MPYSAVLCHCHGGRRARVDPYRNGDSSPFVEQMNIPKAIPLISGEERLQVREQVSELHHTGPTRLRSDDRRIAQCRSMNINVSAVLIVLN